MLQPRIQIIIVLVKILKVNIILTLTGHGNSKCENWNVSTSKILTLPSSYETMKWITSLPNLLIVSKQSHKVRDSLLQQLKKNKGKNKQRPGESGTLINLNSIYHSWIIWSETKTDPGTIQVLQDTHTHIYVFLFSNKKILHHMMIWKIKNKLIKLRLSSLVSIYLIKLKVYTKT